MTAGRDHGFGGFDDENPEPEGDETRGTHAHEDHSGHDDRGDHDTTRHERMASSTPPGPQGPADGSAGEPAGGPADENGPGDGGQAGLSSEEEVLRRLLHDTVHDVRPSPSALDHLRRAVPARRAHRRQAIVGVAASLMLAVTAVPALIHTANTASSSASAPDSESAVHSAQGGKGDPDSGPTRGPGSKPSGGGESDGKGDKGKGSDSSTEPSGESPGQDDGGTDPSDTMIAGAPECVPAQLGASPADVGPADADGRVYGSFRVVNASQDGCSVSAPGQLTAAAQGSADPARITVAAHTAGGPAPGLPDAVAQTLVLEPGEAYVVRFGWVPESGTNGCESSDPTGSGGNTGTTSGTEGESGDEPGAGDPSGAPPGSVAVTYTPAGGAASVSGQVSNVCAGTVYYTPPMAAA